LVKDNANWDDPAVRTYGELDKDWVRDMWGKSSADTNYNFVFVLDSSGNGLSSYRFGKEIKPVASSFFGSTLPLILQTLPSDMIHFGTVSSLANVNGELAVLAAAPILPQDKTIAMTATKPNILVFGRYLSAAVTQDLEKQFSLEGLSFKPLTQPQDGENILADHWGNAVATATWTDRHPGDEARNKYSSTAFALILCLCCAMVPVTIAHFKAITSLSKKEQAAFHEARHDKLSGLPNRTYFSEAIDKIKSTESVSLIYLDLDGFKHINDTYGHETGDKLICHVSEYLRNLVGDKGFLTRLGGDEFSILLVGSNAAKTSEAIATAILERMTIAFDIEGRQTSVGASIGIANAVRGEVDKSEIMRRADIAMYAAKEAGRKRICWFDSSLDLHRQEDESIAIEMRQLVERKDFDVAFQPILDAKTRTIVTVEALARWPQSSNRKLSPDRFIKVAEENGIIDSLGMLILEKALASAGQWKGIRLSINVSPVQLTNKDLTSEIIGRVKSANFNIENLILEITESSLIKNPDRARTFMMTLRSHGAKIALDDFGIGYASVGYLRDFQFDKIKLDKSLTQNILSDISTQRIVQGTVLIAKGLSAHVVAEGVETDEEARIMYLTGCNYLQGFYFFKPKTAAEITDLLHAQSIANPEKKIAI
jgi:diguanylate cyclase (GGDEF)-like protein